jgi:hypothetical protein
VRLISILRAYLLVGLFGISAWAAGPVADNGSGTARLPVELPYVNEVATPFMIINGLPGGTTIQISAVIQPPASSNEVAGGSFVSGTTAGGSGMVMNMHLIGTGGLAGYNRFANIPLGAWQQDNGARTNFAPVQLFPTDLTQLQGQLPPGDPDFDLLRITGGSAFGLPSPGQTRFTQSGPQWNVDSFFDLTYRIDFVGHPGGPVGGMSGSTTGTSHIFVGDSVPEPGTAFLALSGVLLLLGPRRRFATAQGVPAL